jgi:hypothetical protein
MIRELGGARPGLRDFGAEELPFPFAPELLQRFLRDGVLGIHGSPVRFDLVGSALGSAREAGRWSLRGIDGGTE